MTKSECKWYLEDYNFSQWESDCGLSWYMSNDETPKENEMNYCPKCGRKLVEEVEENGKD